MIRDGWFTETLHAHMQQRLEVEEVLYHRQTEFQDLVVFRNPRLGRVLALDGAVQTTEADEFAYHEMMAHVPVLAHGAARRVLIIGGGDGGVLREVLKHRSVERATMVEIDPFVVDVCREYMPALSAGAFDDPRAELVFADGVEFVRTSGESFDVVIIDSTDPVGPATPLFDTPFYADCARRLAERGILVNQSGVCFMQPHETIGTAAKFRSVFADSAIYLCQVPTYAFGFMSIGWGSLSPEPRRTPPATLAERFAAADIETRYYTPEVHAAAFALPAYIARAAG